jgi:acyl-CoA synthetase (AMP-forming)/AMP-acid ligase II
MTIHELIDRSSRRNPEAVAIAASGRKPMSYARLYSQLLYVSQTLGKLGINRQDRVAIVLRSSPELAVTMLTVDAVAACAPLNPDYRTAEFEFYLGDINPKAVILLAGSTTSARAVAQKRGIAIIELSPLAQEEAGAFALSGPSVAPPCEPGFAGPDDVALLLHTSGTTSGPKLVPLTQANICSSAQNVAQFLGLTPADRGLNVMPLFHIHGIVGSILCSIAAGASVFCSGSFSVFKFIVWFNESSPTWYTAVPTIHQMILGQAGQFKGMSHRMRFIRSASDVLPAAVREGLEGAFGVPVIECYGMTEASQQITSSPLPPKIRKPGSVGVASATAVAIMGPDGGLLQTGEKGEVVIKGESVTRGYEHNEDANRSAFVNGWFRTGDVGYLDADGYLFLVGRSKEIINRAGEKVSPFEVEAALMAHPAVAQAIVFAVPDKAVGEDVGAAVVLKKSVAAAEAEILEFLESRLSSFKVPHYLKIVGSIPKGDTGKIQRKGMAQQLRIHADETDGK